MILFFFRSIKVLSHVCFCKDILMVAERERSSPNVCECAVSSLEDHDLDAIMRFDLMLLAVFQTIVVSERKYVADVFC